MLVSAALTGWVYFISSTPNNTIINNRYTSGFFLFCVWLYITIVVMISGNLTIDMIRYTTMFSSFSSLSISQAFNVSDWEPLFTFFVWSLSQITKDENVLRLMVWLFVSFFITLAIKNVMNSYKLLIVLYSYYSYFLVFTLTTTIVRQGISISILMIAISILITGIKKRKTFYISIITAPLFHISALPCSIILFVLHKFKIKTKMINFIWLFSTLTFITGSNEKIFNKLITIIPQLSHYSSSDVIDSYGGINRLDFLLFGFAFILFGLYAYKKLLDNDETYRKLLNIYILFNSVFLLTGFIAYSNRVAAFSWILIPLVVWYPLLKSEKANIKKYRIILILSTLTVFVLISKFGKSLMF